MAHELQRKKKKKKQICRYNCMTTDDQPQFQATNLLWVVCKNSNMF